uniref:Uncharacterized protein n=1 Tax=Arion vulgaris TaxID=1028688 RepID=A0A0B6ZZL9_9EUPU
MSDMTEASEIRTDQNSNPPSSDNPGNCSWLRKQWSKTNQNPKLNMTCRY